jgi:hypothetical protein
MKKLINLLFIFAFLLICSCKHKKSDVVIELDVSRTDTLYLSQIADSISYIQLETNEECLLGGISKVLYINGIYYISDRSFIVYMFDSAGKYIAQLNRFGRDEGEYSDIQALVVDSVGHIHIMDNGRIVEYNANLEFIAKTRFQDFPRDFYITGNKYVLYMPDKNIDCMRGLYSLDRQTDKYSEIIKISSRKEIPCMLNQFIVNCGNGKFGVVDNTLLNIYYLDNDVLAKTFHIEGKKIGNNKKEEFVIVNFLDYDSCSVLFLATQADGGKMKICRYDKKTGESLVFAAIVNDFDGKSGITTKISGNTMTCLVAPVFENKDSEQNPALQIIHLKQ